MRQGDRSVVDEVLELLEADYQVLFVQFPNPDYFGHLTGWMSETYINELYSTDYQIGRILEILDSLGIRDETLLIITADHGGHDDLHGANIPEDMTIPWIMNGPNVPAGTQLSDVQITQTAATVLAAFDIPIPPAMAAPVLADRWQLEE